MDIFVDCLNIFTNSNFQSVTMIHVCQRSTGWEFNINCLDMDIWFIPIFHFFLSNLSNSPGIKLEPLNYLIIFFPISNCRGIQNLLAWNLIAVTQPVVVTGNLQTLVVNQFLNISKLVKKIFPLGSEFQRCSISVTCWALDHLIPHGLIEVRRRSGWNMRCPS